jgi:hypothetical protein
MISLGVRWHEHLTFILIIRIFSMSEHGKNLNKRNMNPPPDYWDILQKAADALREETGINLVTLAAAKEQEEGGLDANMQIEQGTTRLAVHVEVVGAVREVHAAQLANRFGETGIPGLLITRHVPLTMAKKMRRLNVQFVDTVGNVYINIPPIHVFICGNKPTDQRKTQAEKGIFTKGGVKVVFALLCEPQLKDATYRQIAEDAAVAIGTVDTVMKRLQYHRFLIDLGTRGRRLERKQELLDRWVVAYAEQLRPKQLMGTYRPAREVDWINEEGLGEGAFWGGETAAAKLTHYLKPLITTLYTRRPVKSLYLKYKLIADPKGLVELREIFWNFRLDPPIPHVVPPLLIYADLMAHADPRNVETARIIYDDYLERHLREG